MAKINDTTTFPNTSPALADHVIGTDVSDTSNSVDGETVTFLLSEIVKLWDGLVHIETQVGDGTTTQNMDFTGFDSSLYGDYLFRLSNVGTTAGATSDFKLQTSSDGGSTYDSGGSDYSYGPTGSAYDSTAASFILLDTSFGGKDDDLNGELTVHAPDLAVETMIRGQWFGESGGVPYETDLAGKRNSTADVDAVRFTAAGGYFTTDSRISMFGYRRK